MGRGVFTLSLDLELGWGSWASGRWDSSTFASGSAYARRLDALARELRTPFTWAVVGAVHSLSLDELADLPDDVSVAAARPGLGPFRQPLPTAGRVRAEPRAFLDAEVVDVLAGSSAGHEIGTHTYFHATPTTAAGLQADVAACRRALPAGCALTSIVYPRDEVRHVESLAAGEVRAYRSPPATRRGRGHGPRPLRRVVHLAEQAVGSPAPLVRPRRRHGTADLPSSGVLTLRHGLRRDIPLAALRRRFLGPLDDAVRRGGQYHLYTHPWNLGIPGSDAVELLEEVCARAAALRDRGDLEVITMAQVEERLPGGAS